MWGFCVVMTTKNRTLQLVNRFGQHPYETLRGKKAPKAVAFGVLVVRQLHAPA